MVLGSKATMVGRRELGLGGGLVSSSYVLSLVILSGMSDGEVLFLVMGLMAGWLSVPGSCSSF